MGQQVMGQLTMPMMFDILRIFACLQFQITTVSRPLNLYHPLGRYFARVFRLHQKELSEPVFGRPSAMQSIGLHNEQRSPAIRYQEE